MLRGKRPAKTLCGNLAIQGLRRRMFDVEPATETDLHLAALNATRPKKKRKLDLYDLSRRRSRLLRSIAHIVRDASRFHPYIELKTYIETHGHAQLTIHLFTKRRQDTSHEIVCTTGVAKSGPSFSTCTTVALLLTTRGTECVSPNDHLRLAISTLRNTILCKFT